MIDRSVEKPWEYPQYQFTDQQAEHLIVENVRAVLLDFLPQEIPYQLQCEMELFEYKKSEQSNYLIFSILC